MKAVTVSLALLAAWQFLSPAEAAAQAVAEKPTRQVVRIEFSNTPRPQPHGQAIPLVILPDADEPGTIGSYVQRPFVTSVRNTDEGREPVITVFREGLSATVRATSGAGDSVTVDLSAKFDEIVEVSVKPITPTVSVQQVRVKSQSVRFVETLVPGDSVQCLFDSPGDPWYFVLSLQRAAGKMPTK